MLKDEGTPQWDNGYSDDGEKWTGHWAHSFPCKAQLFPLSTLPDSVLSTAHWQICWSCLLTEYLQWEAGVAKYFQILSTDAISAIKEL